MGNDNKFVRAVITILALGDGVIHFLLDFVLFRGNFFGGRPPTAPPPGRAAPPAGARGNPLILPLNELFLLNFGGYIVLAALFLFGERWLGKRSWIVEAVMIVYAAAAFVAWVFLGRPNPMGLGYLSKTVEVLLIVTLSAHLWVNFKARKLAPGANVRQTA